MTPSIFQEIGDPFLYRKWSLKFLKKDEVILSLVSDGNKIVGSDYGSQLLGPKGTPSGFFCQEAAFSRPTA